MATKTSKPKGVIKKSASKPSGSLAKTVKGVANIASMLPGTVGAVGKVASVASSLLGVTKAGEPVFGARRRKRGLTYNEIRGANKVLKLVKRFAPAGSKFKLKSKRRSAY